MDILSEVMNVLIVVPLIFLTVIMFAPRSLSRAIQRCCFETIEQCLKYVVTKKAKKHSAAAESNIPLNIQKDFGELSEVQWKEINFYDKEYGFPSLRIALFNHSQKVITVKHALFHIEKVGRLRNRVEGHFALAIERWYYNVQFDPLFEDKNVVVDVATTIPPNSMNTFSFTIGQETSDVETPTLYFFHLTFVDDEKKRCALKPFIIAIPSPVKAKSYSLLDERPNVIKENYAILNAFSVLEGYRNPLARKILYSRSKHTSTSG